MFDLVAAVNNDRTLHDNLMRSEVLRNGQARLQTQRGFASAALAYNDALSTCRHDLVVFAHQDVYLPQGWEGRLSDGIARVERIDPRWAVLGVVGVDVTGGHVGHVWSSGLQVEFGSRFEQPVAVQSVDELLIVLRRDSGLRFDPSLPGYHLYGTDIVQAALSGAMGAYVIHAPVIHNSLPCPYLRDDYFRAYEHVRRRWNERLPLRSCAAPIHRSRWAALALRARHRWVALRTSQPDRQALDRREDCALLAKRLSFE
jgi:hypothetical protein